MFPIAHRRHQPWQRLVLGFNSLLGSLLSINFFIKFGVVKEADQSIKKLPTVKTYWRILQRIRWASRQHFFLEEAFESSDQILKCSQGNRNGIGRLIIVFTLGESMGNTAHHSDFDPWVGLVNVDFPRIQDRFEITLQVRAFLFQPRHNYRHWLFDLPCTFQSQCPGVTNQIVGILLQLGFGQIGKAHNVSAQDNVNAFTEDSFWNTISLEKIRID
jgi:hypothetical protein